MVGGAEGERERALHEKLNVNHPVHAHQARFNTRLTKRRKRNADIIQRSAKKYANLAK